MNASHWASFETKEVGATGLANFGVTRRSTLRSDKSHSLGRPFFDVRLLTKISHSNYLFNLSLRTFLVLKHL